MTSHSRRRRFRLAAAAAIATALVATAACTSSSNSPDNSNTGDEDIPKAGGTLRVGIVGGSAKDTLDAHAPVTHPDEARAIALYDTLATYDTEHQVEMSLAEEITPSEDGKTWTVRLRDGLKFSDGSPITAADVIFTLKRITDPKDPKASATSLKDLDRTGMKAENDQTVVIPFKAPFVTFPDAVAQYATGIVPEGYDVEEPVSSGPFMFDSFTRGQQSSFVKNPNYWREGQPYVDELVIIDFPDDTARVNALLGGQVDAIDQLPLGQINVVEGNPQLKVLESQTGSWIPFTMRVDQAPFDDVRVRQAMRLIVDRQEMVDQVLGGHGTIGNDMYAPLDPCYPAEIPQREQDIDQAKQLLADAGQSDLTVELITSPAAAGLVEAAQVFAQQAKEAGVNVKVNKVDPGVFYGDDYLSWKFAQDFWFTRDYLPQTANSGFTSSPYNETHWDHAEWNDLVNKANATVDEAERCELIQQAQQIEYDEGGYIIWGFPNNLDAHSTSVKGLVPDKSGIPLTSYGFRNVWLDE
jgi:peptide/nickel transport system substrate-binding protein